APLYLHRRMGMGLFAGFGFFIIIPLLIAQWVGIIGIGKWQRNKPWWTMTVGTGLATLSTILMVGFIIYSSGWLSGLTGSHRFGGSVMMFMFASGALSTLGSLLFAVGFAVHG